MGNGYQKRNAAQLDSGAAFKSSGITVSNANYFQPGLYSGLKNDPS